MKRPPIFPTDNARIFQYLLLISPSVVITAKVKALKQTMADLYGCEHVAKLNPQMTLATFIQYGSHEFRIINCIEKLTTYVAPMEINLNGFDFFSSHTLYIKVEDPEPFSTVVKELRSKFQRLMKFSDSYPPKFTMQPHLTVARGLSELQQERLAEVYRKESFEESFTAGEIILVKRELDPATMEHLEKYKTAYHFSLLDKKREAQLALF